MSIKTLNISTARAMLPEIVRKVSRGSGAYLITTNGTVKAAILGKDEYESWLETVNILADKGWVEDLRQAEEDVKNNRIVSFEEVAGRKQKS